MLTKIIFRQNGVQFDLLCPSVFSSLGTAKRGIIIVKEFHKMAVVTQSEIRAKHNSIEWRGLWSSVSAFVQTSKYKSDLR